MTSLEYKQQSGSKQETREKQYVSKMQRTRGVAQTTCDWDELSKATMEVIQL